MLQTIEVEVDAQGRYSSFTTVAKSMGTTGLTY
jgi:hypothetical protein